MQPIIYADDIVIYLSTSNEAYAQKWLQKAIDNINVWTINNGLKISIPKTRYISFHRHNKHNLNITIQNQQLLNTNQNCFLGLTFDQKLRWEPHINVLKASCIKAMNILKILSMKNNGSDRKTLKKVYDSLILSKMDYGCIIYNSAKNTKLKPLDTIHNSCLRMISGAYRTTPIKSLICEMGETTLHDRRNLATLKYFLKLVERNIPKHNYTVTSNPYEHLFRQKKLPLPISLTIKNILTKYNISQNLIQNISKKPNMIIEPPWQKNIVK